MRWKVVTASANPDALHQTERAGPDGLEVLLEPKPRIRRGQEVLPQGSGLSVREPQRMLQGVLGWEVHNTASEVLQQLEHSQPSSHILRLAQLGLLWGWNHKATSTFG